MPGYAKSFFIFLLFTSGCLWAREKIHLFDVNIQVRKDTSIRVVETITVSSERKKIVRGITREIPIKFAGILGTNFETPIQIESVTCEGVSQAYRLEYTDNGILLRIGSSDRMLPVGKHTFVITYIVGWIIGSFNANDADEEVRHILSHRYDELNWSATGQFSSFLIEKVRVRVQLPFDVPPESVALRAFTQGYKKIGSDYRAGITSDQTLFFETTRALNPYEGLTIVVGWPTGFIEYPSWWEYIAHFVHDNPFFIYALLMTGMVLLFSIAAIYTMRYTNRSGIIIPLFSPPKNISPGLARFLLTGMCDERGFAAELVNMAVNGLLLIDYQVDKEGASYYKLKKNNKPAKPLSHTYQRMYELLFTKNESIFVDTQWEGRSVLSTAYAFVRREFERISHRYFDEHAGWVGGLFFASLATVLPVIIFGEISIGSGWFWIMAVVLLICNILVNKNAVTYTKLGRMLADQLIGFKMFLSTAEKERMRVVGTPPTKTPELYEKYLPYAIALGVEEQWSYQFAPIFAKYAQAKSTYKPSWGLGENWTVLETSALAMRLPSAISRSIGPMLRTTPIVPGMRPGAKTGFGRNDPGSGGGGGGVGGW